MNMAVNGISTNYSPVTAYSSSSAAAKETAETQTAKEAESGVVYEGAKGAQEKPATYSAGVKNADQASIIDKLKADAEARTQQLADLVNKLISKQADADKTSKLPLGDLMKAVANGEIEVDPETVKQAQEDVAEGGYYSVEETAKRLIDFAKAISGDDSSKGEQMRAAIDKGFKEATKTWGSELPEISQKTHDRVNELMDAWIKG